MLQPPSQAHHQVSIVSHFERIWYCTLSLPFKITMRLERELGLWMTFYTYELLHSPYCQGLLRYLRDVWVLDFEHFKNCTLLVLKNYSAI
jgi:hypothetical protein